MPANRSALYSLAAALLTVLSFCVGLAPFLPLTAGICYPAAMLLGLTALLTGWRALRQIETSGESGRWMALTGLWVGGLTMLAVLCASALTLSLLALGAGYLHNLWPGSG